MNKTFILLLILSVLILTAKSLETNDKLEIQDTFTKSIIQQILRKSYLGTNCPPEQSKTYCSGSQPCCKVGNKYGCCPYSYGTCCGDGTCVPSGGRC
ncbi:unnamed protein product [Paramecium pentaurelia]|uniref:Granulins domain-containing protein n=1 Tax=Paramecium pentaurelia TaxID=43138 RepID=A0A8S1RV99_9CILI|nr:unnamed protein product [Paramecium pentaurelia]